MAESRSNLIEGKEDYLKGHLLYMKCQYSQSFPHFARAMGKGHHAACLKVAYMRFEGKAGVKEDQQQANAYFKQLQAAALDYPES